MNRRVSARFTLMMAGLATIALPGDARAQQRFYQQDERVTVSDGGTLYAVAAAPLEIFVLSDLAILVWDVARSRWKIPIPLPRESRAVRPTALAWDPAGGTLWLGTEAGDVFTTVPGFGRWDRLAIMARGRVESLVPWPRDAAVYARVGGAWFRIAAGSFMGDNVSAAALPPGVTSAASGSPDDPYLAAARGTLGLDPRGRRWPVTGVAAGREAGEYWIATGGGGLIHYDAIGNRQQWIRWGTIGNGVASVSMLGDRLWLGSNGDPPGGVATSTASLGEWQQFDQGDGAPAGFVAETVTFAGSTWFGSSDGLFRLDRPEAERVTGRGEWSRLGTVDGLASDRVRSLAVAWGLIWAGTDRGLTPFDSSGTAMRSVLFPGRQVNRLALRNDTLWIATDDGLWRIVASGGNVTAASGPTRVLTPPGVRGRVNDVLAAVDLTFAIADGLVYDVDGPSAPLRDAMLDRIGPALRLAEEAGQLWVAGPRGAAYRDPVTRVWHALTVPADVPAGPVLDVLPVAEDVWVATPEGAVRLRWR